MNKLFYPAIVMMNKLGFTQKIMLLGGIYFIALATVIFSIYTLESKAIHKTEYELQGIVLIKPVLQTIQNAQRHRGLSAGIIGGELAFMEDLHTESALLKYDFNRLTDTLPEALKSTALWQDILTSYQHIQASGLTWSKEVNFATHTRLISKLQQLIIELADRHALMLDDDMASYYLIITTLTEMPLALEQLGQIRAYGTGIQAKKALPEQQKIKLHHLLATLKNTLESLNINLHKTGQLNAHINTTLASALNNINHSSDQVVQLVHNDIFSQRFTIGSQGFFNATTKIINTEYAQIYQTLLPTLERLLHERMQEAKKRLFISIGTAILLALLAQYLFFGIYYASTANIRLLARAAHQYTLGNLQQRIYLDTQDDIKQIGDSFNAMADSFQQLLSAHKEDKERLQAIVNTALDAIIQINAQGIVTGWSRQAELMFGWSAFAAKGQAIHTLIIPAQLQEQHLKGIQDFLVTGEGNLINRRIETTALNRKGLIFPIELSISPVKTKKGTEFSAFIRDLSDVKKTENTLRKLSLAVEQSPSSTLITDIDANIEYANQAFLNATGYNLDEVIGKNPRIFSAKKSPKSTYDAMWQTLRKGEIWRGELINRRKDGREYIESALISPVRQKNGEITHYLAIKEDITAKKQAEIELGLAAIAFESHEGIMITDITSKILRVNTAFTQITGYSSDEVIGKPANILNSGRQDKSFYLAMWQQIKRTGSWQGEIWNRHKQGYIYPEWLTITARKDADNITTHYVAIFTDITQFKAAEEKIKVLAYYDPLTQLPNRRKLLDRLKHGISVCLREGTQLAILMLDLDRFKAVNDSFGHLAGDELLQQVATRITQRLRATDLLARLGGDEFVVLLEDIRHPNDVARIAEDIIADLAQPFLLNKNKEALIGTSIGISLFPEHADSTEILMDHADMALYQAKDKGRGCYAYFSESLTRLVHERLELEANLRLAIGQQELRVYYQPQVDILTGDIIGAEALVRWQTAENGLISPIKFIPIAEETGLILDIGAWVLQEVCRQGQQWLTEGYQPITLAVNVSAQQFKRANMYDLVAKTLKATRFPAQQLELEMTESGLMEQHEAVVDVLLKLRSLGILLAIDDFGTGYSSLAYLKRFPLDTLKIDKSFIDDIPHDQDSVEIANTINTMGHSLGFKVLAEGVETREQLDFLKMIGCDTYQGYIKSKPLPANEFAKLLKAQNKHI